MKKFLVAVAMLMIVGSVHAASLVSVPGVIFLPDFPSMQLTSYLDINRTSLELVAKFELVRINVLGFPLSTYVGWECTKGLVSYGEDFDLTPIAGSGAPGIYDIGVHLLCVYRMDAYVGDRTVSVGVGFNWIDFKCK